MSSLKAVSRRLGTWVMVWACWLAIQGAAWAGPPVTTNTEKAGPGSWVLPYVIVILCIALGMLVVCRTARRAERARPEKYEAVKTAD
ncbi:MAG TPA: hypothetical protein VJL29_14770 [Thermoguttaceae bacterium]|nr:hypothetical protein [Thermoguttaceae bacterium]